MANKVYDIRIEVEGLQQGERAVNQVRELSEAEKRRKKAFDEANKTMQDSVNKQASSYSKLANLAKTAGIAIAGMFAIDKIKDFTAEVFKITATFQKFEAVLTNTLGSRSEAQKALKQINDFAASTPFSVEELTESFVKLANAGFKPTTEEMTKLGDLASATGKSFDQLTEAILDAQSFEFERLKEFGIKASQNGDKIAFSFKGVTTEVAKTNDAVRAYILSLGNLQGVSGGMAAISKTLEGQISNLGDTFDQLKLAIGDRLAGAFSEAIGMASDLLNTLKGFIEIPIEDKIIAEREEFTALARSLQDTNVQGEARNLIISELQAKYGEYLGNLDLEKASYEQLEVAIRNANIVFEKKRLLAVSQEGDKKLNEELNELYTKQARAVVEVQKALEGYRKSGVSESELANIKSQLEISFGVKDLNEQIANVKKEQLAFQQAINRESIDQVGLSTKNLKAEQDRLDFIKKEEEGVFKAARLFAEENAKKADEQRKKEQKAIEDANKKAEELRKKRLEEEAKERAEFALREIEAQREVENTKIQNQIETFKRIVADKQASTIEVLNAERALANLELLLLQKQNEDKKKQYFIDKDNRIQVKKLTASELEQIELETQAKQDAIRANLQEKTTSILKSAEDKRGDIIKEGLERAKNNIFDWQKNYEDAQKAATKAQEEEQKKRDTIIEKSGQFAQQVGNAIFEFDKINNEKKLQALQTAKDAELKLAGDNAQNRAFVEAKFANEEKKLKEGQARADRNKALFDIAIQTAVGIAKAISASPLTFGLPFSAVVAAQGAIQAAVVASRPLPKFKDGVEFLEGPGTGTSDSITARLSRGERVITAKTNKEYYPTLSAIHNGLISPDAINSFVTGVKVDNSSNSLKGEIKMLAKQVETLTRVVENQVKHNISIDSNGFSHFVESERERTEILNKRYEFG